MPNAAPDTIISSNTPSGGESSIASFTGVIDPKRRRPKSPVLIGGAGFADAAAKAVIPCVEVEREDAGVALGVR